MTNNCQVVWDRCLHIIKRNVPPQSFQTWFEPIRPVQLEDSVLTIAVPNKLFYEWLEENYVQVLRTSIHQVLGKEGRLRYCILNGSDGRSNSPNKALSETAASSESSLIPGTFDIEKIKDPRIIPGIRRDRVDPNLNPNYTFEQFIEGDCNRLARNAGIAVAKKPGGTAFNPLFIYGAVGLGKTHLAQAIGNDIVQRFPEKLVLYVSTEEFTNQIIQAIKKNDVNAFVNFYQSLDVLIMDDIQFLSGKQKTQEIFFFLFNQLHQTGRQIILTSDRPPRDLEDIEDRLISRFKWGLSADLQAPDLETRIAILGAKLERAGVKANPEVLEYICYNVKDNVRDLEGVMAALLAQTTLMRREISLDLAREAIRNFVASPNRGITIEALQKLVADHFNLPVERLSQESRKRQFVVPRHVAIYLCKRLTNASLKAIGKAFGGRDHSTIIYSLRTVQDMLDTDASFRATMEEIEKKVKMTFMT
ncbi:MAG: chromosomal replication initiator protein DnaA [Saprospiraceae bacterium]|nr:chromosomal replication initiator protein DnaA [Saprospiraceae bacterium]MDW8484762.1 chromosomal replication initiator protein DnaA [Saprospiraceae bacterium]